MGDAPASRLSFFLFLRRRRVRARMLARHAACAEAGEQAGTQRMLLFKDLLLCRACRRYFFFFFFLCGHLFRARRA